MRSVPRPSLAAHPELLEASERLKRYARIVGFKQALWPGQLSLRPKKLSNLVTVHEVVVDLLINIVPAERVVVSSVAVNVLAPGVSKLNVLRSLKLARGAQHGPSSFLRIGDRGQSGGNDYELLRSGIGLSVDMVSGDLDNCWNLGLPKSRGEETSLTYLRAISRTTTGFRLDIDRLSEAAKAASHNNARYAAQKLSGQRSE